MVPPGLQRRQGQSGVSRDRIVIESGSAEAVFSELRLKLERSFLKEDAGVVDVSEHRQKVVEKNPRTDHRESAPMVRIDRIEERKRANDIGCQLKQQASLLRGFEDQAEIG